MNYLTLWIIPNTEYIQHYFTNNRLHKTLCSLFGNYNSERPYVYKAIEGKKDTIIVIRSSITPSKDPVVGRLETTKEELPKKGASYILSTKINPIITKTVGSKSTRVPLSNEVDIKKWFLKRIESNGFSIESDAHGSPTISCSPPVRNYMTDRGAFYITSSDIKAIVKVTDENKSAQLFTKGIGRERAYGYGMISLVPVSLSTYSDEDSEEND